MCGLFGFIGKSADPRISFDLAHALFVKTETRGEHAAGFWACERGNGRIFFDKEPTKSSIYVTRDIWSRQFANTDTDLLLGHCRYSTTTSGNEKYNKNNHPHVSADRRVALVHNGKILEYSRLKSRYVLNSNCDSEIILSMFESAEKFKNKEDYLYNEFPNLTPDLAYRMLGLREIFARLNYGAMAVAIGERAEDTLGRYLWLFRDEERPLHVVDMRDTLGQMFFCSTAEIWKGAVDMCPMAKKYIPSDIIEFPPFQVWLLSTKPNPEFTEDAKDVPENIWKTKKFRVIKTKFYDWKEEEDTETHSRIKSKPVTEVVSRLTADEEIAVKKEKPPLPKVTEAKALAEITLTETAFSEQDLADPHEDQAARSAAISSFDEKITELRKLLNDIETQVTNLDKEQSLAPKDLATIMDSLKDAYCELNTSSLFLLEKQ